MADNDNSNQVSEGSEDNGSFGEVVSREAPTTEGEQSEVAPQSETPAGGQEETPVTTPAKEEKAEEPVLTEKGTKLDPNPQSAVYQQLANEKAKNKQFEQVLSNRDLLDKYIATQFPAPVKEPEAKAYTPADFESLDDVARVVNELQTGMAEKTKSYEAQIKELTNTVSGLLRGGEAQRLVSTMSEDVTTLRAEPELNSNSPEFIKGLEEDIASMYHKLDYDEKTDSYKGQYSMKDIGDRMIAAARKARQKGSLQAQTVVKDKSEGKVVTSPKVKEESDSDNLNPGDSIAAGISKMFK